MYCMGNRSRETNGNGTRFFDKQPKQNIQRHEGDINQSCVTAGDSKKKTVLQPGEGIEKAQFFVLVSVLHIFFHIKYKSNKFSCSSESQACETVVLMSSGNCRVRCIHEL